MKNLVLVGVLSTFTVLGAVSMLAPARAVDDSLPVGTIIAWGGQTSSIPKNWALCNGKVISKTAYPDLFTAIGTSWGSSGADKFNLPDLRGRFLRGDDAGTGRDPDAKKRLPSYPGGSTSGVGSAQEDSFQDHSHNQQDHRHSLYNNDANLQAIASGSGAFTGVGTLMSSTQDASVIIQNATQFGTHSKIKTGEESRPKNAAVNFIIKMK